jgi:hypothetical protein
VKVHLLADSESFVQWEHDWIVGHCLANFDVTLSIDPALEVRNERTILVVSGGLAGRVHRIQKAIEAAHAEGMPPAMIHLSDEYGNDDLSIYASCDAVFRNYFRADAAKLPNCFTFPLGYRSGFHQACKHIPFTKRQTPWAFAGEPKGSRIRMLAEMADWADGTSYLTTCWNDPNALSSTEYAQLLCDTRLVPCPVGICAPESFRLYEALEAGAVPVVEDLGGGFPLLFKMLKLLYATARNSPKEAAKQVGRIFEESYWTTVYGNDFPVLRIQDWAELRPLLAVTDLDAVAVDTANWWQLQKQKVREEFYQRLNAVFNPIPLASAANKSEELA